MKKILFIALILTVVGCKSKQSSGYITVSVLDVEQVGSYTYMLVEEKGPEYWIAVTTTDAKPGDKFHYTGGMVMEDFYSTQLDRTFEKVIFLDEIIAGGMRPEKGNLKADTPGSKIKSEKSEIVIDRVEGVTSIADLYKDPKSFSGEVIKVQGEVTRFNSSIMDRNWVHIQDGTEYNGKFDLTITTNEDFEVGSVVIIIGKLALDKDFGYGYSYELLLEEATAVR